MKDSPEPQRRNPKETARASCIYRDFAEATGIRHLASVAYDGGRFGERCDTLETPTRGRR